MGRGHHVRADLIRIRLRAIRHRCVQPQNRRLERLVCLTSESLPLQALEMASWAATHDLTGLVHHAGQAVNSYHCAIPNGLRN